jgi:hypothetical protein
LCGGRKETDREQERREENRFSELAHLQLDAFF